MKFIALALVLSCAACALPPPPRAGANPSDSKARTSAVGYRSTIAPYASQRPVEPAPWQERNERVAPERKP